MKTTNILILALFLIVLTSINVKAVINVTGCMVLNESAAYELNQSFVANNDACLLLINNNATLDCKGFIIDGNSTYQELIRNIDTNVTNCNLYNWGSNISKFSSSAISYVGGFSKYNNVFSLTNSIFNDTISGGENGLLTTSIYFGNYRGSNGTLYNNTHIITSNHSRNCYSIFQVEISPELYYNNFTNMRLPCGINSYYGVNYNFSFTNVTGEDNKYIIFDNRQYVNYSNLNNVSQIVIAFPTVSGRTYEIKNVTFNHTNYIGSSINLATAANIYLTDVYIENGSNAILVTTGIKYSVPILKNVFIKNSKRYSYYGQNSNSQYGHYFDNVTIINENSSFNNTVYIRRDGFLEINNSYFSVNYSDVVVNPSLFNIQLFAPASVYTKIYNNYFNINTGNYFDFSRTTISSTLYYTYFNTSFRIGTRIFSNGLSVGGNYYTNSINTGQSDICTDLDFNGICDSSYVVAQMIGNSPFYDYLSLSSNYDIAKPTVLSNELPSSSRKYNDTIQFQLNLTDNYRVTGVIFSWNQSGSFVNDSYVSTNVQNYSINVTKVINLTRGSSICWLFYFNDTYSNTDNTSTQCFTVNNTAPVINTTFISPSPSIVLDNMTCNYTAYDYDLDTYSVTTTNWYISGILNTTYHNNTLPGGVLLGNDTIQCSLMINDSYENATSWGTSPLVVMTDALAPIMSNLPNTTSVYTDETKRLNITCIDPEGSDIANGFPLISYTDPDGLVQGNFSMSSNGSGIFYYQSTFSKVGKYTNFQFYCMDSQSHSSSANGTFNISASVRPLSSGPTGGGGNIIVSSVAETCNWEFNQQEIIFIDGEMTKRLILSNNENFSINPTYTITGTSFVVAGQKQLLPMRSQTELTILKQINDSLNRTITETLSVFSPECLPVKITFKYTPTNQSTEDFFYTVGNLAITKIVSDVNVFGFKLKFWYFTILSVVIVFLIVRKSDTSPLLKFTSGTIMVIIINILLAAVLANGL